MEHRVAITGIGAVTPLGNTAPATWEAMLAGRCGIGPITRFDAEGFAVQVAAEVKGFDGEAYFGRREARHLDRCVQFAMAVCGRLGMTPLGRFRRWYDVDLETFRLTAPVVVE